MARVLRFISAGFSAVAAASFVLGLTLMLTVARADEPLNNVNCTDLSSCVKNTDGSCDKTGVGANCTDALGQ